MLILPPGHGQSIRQPLTLRRRERVMIGSVLAALAALAVVVVFALGTGERQSGHGCVSVGLAYSTGGAEIYRCGSAARAMCATVHQPGGSHGATAQALTTQCRKAGLPVG